MELPPLGLYVHLPWCERKCPYCDFNSHELTAIPEADYVNALLGDLDLDSPLAQGREVDTVFIGGGTPSLFSAEAINRLLEGVRDRIQLALGAEITMEANPGSAEADKFRGFREAGVTRLSLGVQSFDDRALVALGRVHDREQALRAIEYAQAAGFNSLNIDLMHGLPGQSVDAGMTDLVTAIGFEPPHLSWYQLTIEPNTVFHKRPPLLPVEDELADIQEQGEALLETGGYLQYEVSAYSRAGQQCRHNLNYWGFGDYLAIGAGAHGKISTPQGEIRRYAKTRGPQDYLAASGQWNASERTLSREDIISEFMLYALRLNEGFTVQRFEGRTSLPVTVLEAPLRALVDEDLLLWDDSGIRATELGRRFLDTVIGRFL